MKYIALIVAAVLALLLFNSFIDPPIRGAVMSQGETIRAKNEFGTIIISYETPVKRRYIWDDEDRIVRMKVRPDAFMGEYGLYEPAVSMGGFSNKIRLVVLEATHNYDSYAEIYAALREGSDILDWVYTQDGLVVGFGRFPDRNQVNVVVRQILLNGKKPVLTEGVRGDRIQVSY